jgi:hypothetical protein
LFDEGGKKVSWLEGILRIGIKGFVEEDSTLSSVNGEI